MKDRCNDVISQLCKYSTVILSSDVFVGFVFMAYQPL